MSAHTPPLAVVPIDAGPSEELGTLLPALRSALPGPAGRRWIDVLARHECPAITARRARRAEAHGVDQDPIAWARARGANVWDPDGNCFVDLMGGFGVASVGHGHAAVRAAVHQQVDTLIHGLGDAFPGVPRIELSRRLAGVLPGDLEQVIFGSSGSEAVEAAVKTAVMATGRGRVVAFEGGYHGMSLGALPLSHYRPSFREPFAALAGDHVTFLPWGCDARAVAEVVGAAACVLLEPLQGRGGMRGRPDGWIAEVSRATREGGALLIFDEIFSGFGRAGEWVLAGTDAADGVVPDLITLGKGLSSGFPLSACVGTPRAMAGWAPSQGESLHTSTFLGHPVGCAAALAVLELLEGGLLERGRALGRLMGQTLQELVERDERFVAVRGRGAMRGLQVAPGVSAFGLCRELLAAGYLILPAGLHGEVLSFTPPLVLTEVQWRGALAALEAP